MAYIYEHNDNKPGAVVPSFMVFITSGILKTVKLNTIQNIRVLLFEKKLTRTIFITEIV